MNKVSHISLAFMLIAMTLATALLAGCASGISNEGSTSSEGESSSAAIEAPVENTELKEQVEDLIGTREGDVAVAYYSLAPEGDYVTINSDAPLISASIIKLPILACLFKEVAEGDVSLDDECVVQWEDTVGGSGVGLVGGLEFTVGELAELMIAESDNTASNAIISLVGMEQINESLQDMGLEHTLLLHKFMIPGADGENLTSADDVATILRLIANGELESEELSAVAEQYLLEQSDNDALPRGVPETMRLGHKTGALGAARSDGGIVYDAAGNPLCVLVVMTQGMGSGDAEVLIGKIASAVCDIL